MRTKVLNNKTNKATISKTRIMAQAAMLAAVAIVLMLFEFPLPFLAPPFYEMDFSEVPAGVIYHRTKTRSHAIIGMATGTIVMAVMGCFLNAYVLLPAYAAAFGMPVEAFIEMGSAIHSSIDSMMTFMILAVAPFNLLKGVIDSVIVL